MTQKAWGTLVYGVKVAREAKPRKLLVAKIKGFTVF
jgi:hypothetical protein